MKELLQDSSNLSVCGQAQAGKWGLVPSEKRFLVYLLAFFGNFNGDDPFLSPSDKKRGSVIARGIRADSPWRKTGLRVWIAKDYRPFIYTAMPPASVSKPWVCLTSHQTKLTIAAAAAIGLSLDAPLPPDAFGNARADGKIAIGPLETPAPGSQVVIR